MSRAGILVRRIRHLIQGNNPTEPGDRELLERYATTRDEAAFTLLVHRHGPMVWHTCRRSLAHEDAEDVFQATFLVLARKAARVPWRSSIAPWLYAVAHRLACKVRTEAARRPSSGLVECAVADSSEDRNARDLLAALDAELAGLAEKYRGPVVLCWLEGRTQEETAQLLGMSLSTVRRRLEDGKRLLNARLAKHGLTVLLPLTGPVLAALPENVLAGAAPSATATLRARALAESVLAAAGKAKTLVALLCAACLAAVCIVLAVQVPAEKTPPSAQKAPPMPQGKDKESKRVDALGDPLPAGALLRLGSIRLKHHEQTLVAIFSPDGKLVVSGGWDRPLRLWDPETGKELRQILGPKGGVRGLDFSPDGKWLAGAANDHHVYLWEVATGKELQCFKGHQAEVTSVVFAPKGDRLFSCDAKSVRLWRVGQAKAVWTFQTEKGDFQTVAMSPDGGTVAAAGHDGPVRTWETDSGQVRHVLPSQLGPSTALVFSRDNKYLLASGYQNTHCWETATGKLRKKFPGATGRGSSYLAFSPNGKWLALGGPEMTVSQVIRVVDWTTGKVVQSFRRHPDRVRSVGFSPDGKTLVAVADGVPIHLWDVNTGRPKIAFPGHQERLNAVAYFPDGRTVVTGAWDGTVRLWDAHTGQELRQFLVNADKDGDRGQNPESVGHVVVSPDGKWVGAVRGDEQLILWEAATGKEVRRYPASCVAFSPDGRWLAVGGRGTGNEELNKGLIRLYDRVTGKEVHALRGHLTMLGSVAFTPDSKSLISRGTVLFGARFGDPGENEMKHVRVWDVATGKERQTRLGASRINGVILSPDGRTTANIMMLDKTITLWETITGNSRGTLEGHTDMLFDVAFSPDGRTVASASMDGTVRLWDPQAGKEIGRLQGHLGWVLSLAFSPDGKRLISGSLDTTALIWDVSHFTERAPAPGVSTAAELEKAYADLASETLIGYRAIGRLVATPGPTVALLAKRLKPALEVGSKQIVQLVADLDSNQFKVRDQAMRALEKLGEQAAPALEKALTLPRPLESKRRLEGLLDKLDGATLSVETLRQVRAVEVLEVIGTPEARKVLERLAGGVAEVRQTREAWGALQRLKSR